MRDAVVHEYDSSQGSLTSRLMSERGCKTRLTSSTLLCALNGLELRSKQIIGHGGMNNLPYTMHEQKCRIIPT